VRAVQHVHRLTPHNVPVGELGPPSREAIRFLHDPSMAFATSDIVRFDPRVIRNGIPFAQITSSFLGLLGTVSPLAMYFTEEILRETDDEQTIVRDFLDIVHHRVLSLAYRTWKKYRFASGFRSDGADVFTRRAMSFVGVDGHVGRPPEGLSPQRLLSLAHILSMMSRPPRSLERILHELIPGARSQVVSFIGRRVTLADDQICRLGKQSSTLGVDMTVGKTVLDRSGRFRVVIGPLPHSLFQSLMPGGAAFAPLRQVIEQFSRGTLEPEVELRLDDSARLQFQLGGANTASLGVTTILPSRDARPTRARFVLSDQTTVARSVMVDEQAVR
jgi:type VI secretion system protein ImpH